MTSELRTEVEVVSHWVKKIKMRKIVGRNNTEEKVIISMYTQVNRDD